MNLKQKIFIITIGIGAGASPFIIFPDFYVDWLIGYGISGLVVACVVGFSELFDWLGEH